MTARETKFTDQQAAALFAERVSVGLSAGAGCGKTFVLTQRFLQELKPPKSPEVLGQIVAITFTERAAREMRNRIRNACLERVQNCPEEEVLHWQQILRGLDSARISTIHAFCSALLRSQAVEAGIDPAFQILEETTGVAFRNRVIADAFHELLAQQDEHAMQLVLEFGIEKCREICRTLVAQHHQMDFTRFEIFTPETLAEAWQRQWDQQIIPQMLQELIASPTARNLMRLLAVHVPTHDEMLRRCQHLQDYLHKLPELPDPKPMLEELRKSAGVQGGGGKGAWASPEIYDEVKNALTDLRGLMDKVIKGWEPDSEDLLAATKLSLHVLHVARFLSGRYEQKKREHSLLDFEDLLVRSRNLLRNNEIIRQRVCNGIKFLMVDEFQDTDPVQAEIVRYLCGEDLHRGKLFFVGDAKQSIYRFRKADPTVFAQLRSELPEAGQLPLTQNFRSQPAILDFVNCLFAPLMGEDYEPLEPFHKQQLSPPPSIEFLWAHDPAEEEKQNARQQRQCEANWIATRIQTLLADETPRVRSEDNPQQLRRVQPGDIVILFRALSNISLYEEALRKREIGYYLVGGRAFYAQQEIFDVANLCQWIADPEDEVSLLGVLRSPFFSLDDDTLYALFLTGEKNLTRGLFSDPASYLNARQQRQVKYAAQVLRELREKKDRLPLADLLNLAMERTGYDAALMLEFLGSRKLANLRKLIGMAREFDQAGLFLMTDFVDRLRESVSEQAQDELAATHPESSDVVRLMSIHQSKGLEFPVVIVADMNWTRGGGAMGEVLHPELGPLVSLREKFGRSRKNLGMEIYKQLESREEERETLRLLYVALTRAADHLILSAGINPAEKIQSPWLKAIAEQFDLQTGEPLASSMLTDSPEAGLAAQAIPEVLTHPTQPLPDEKTKRQRGEKIPFAELESRLEETPPPGEWPELLTRLTPQPSLNGVVAVESILHSFRLLQNPDHEDTFEELTLRRIFGLVWQRIPLGSPKLWREIVDDTLLKWMGRTYPQLRRKLLDLLDALRSSESLTEMAATPVCHRQLNYLSALPHSPTKLPCTLSGTIPALYRTGEDDWTLLAFLFPSRSVEFEQRLQEEFLNLFLAARATETLLGTAPARIQLLSLERNPKLISVPQKKGDLTSYRNQLAQSLKAMQQQ